MLIVTRTSQHLRVHKELFVDIISFNPLSFHYSPYYINIRTVPQRD